MSIHSQRNASVSAGDAAVLIRALNRQRAEDAAKASRPGAASGEGAARAHGRGASVPKAKTADLDDQVLAFVRRKTPLREKTVAARGATFHRVSVVERTADAGSAALPSDRRPARVREKAAAAKGSDLPSGHRASGSAVRPAGHAPAAKRDRRARRDRASDNDLESRSQRRARAGSRLRSNASEPANPLGAIAARFAALTPRSRKLLAVATCAVALVAFFYGPTADLYAAFRDHDQLVAKVEATKAVADDLKAEVDRLQTEEGVMDEARVRGYAKPDEVAVDASELLDIEDTVEVPELSKPIETEEPPLYIKALDVIMGYEERV